MAKKRRKFFMILLGTAVILPHAGAITSEESGTSISALNPAESMNFNMAAADFKMIRADHWSITGDNLVVYGNVFIPTDSYDIYADRVVINIKNRDFDARGNLRLYQKTKKLMITEPGELAKFEDKAGITYQIDKISTDIFGRQTVEVTTRQITASLKASVLSGNLLTGYFQFSDAQINTYDLYLKAKSGRRLANGIVKADDVTVSTCPYMESDNAHFAISCGSVEIRPYNTNLTGNDRIQKDYSEYSLTAVNCVMRVYGVPLMWMPYFYKPKTETLGLFQIQFGKTSDYGYYLSFSKKYQLLDYPDAWIRLQTDLMERRGVGVGFKGGINTENSRTEYSFYNIYDRNPEKNHDDLDRYGLSIPHYRYDFRISNVTHITPDLDFRGHFEYMSDEFFNEDFSNAYYSTNPRPVTFAALERQFDYFTGSIYFRPQINRFFTTVERLPEVRLDVHRQEILDTNIYFQSETSFDYMQRRWRNMDNPRYEKPYDYHSARFDTVNFLYYPLQLDFLTLVPRAGIRMTAYSNTSDQKIDEQDLAMIQATADPNYWYYNPRSIFRVKDYDNQGGAKVRFIGEIGLQANTKIYRSWQDVRNYWLGLDGLRHVMIPYINYTYIPDPSVNRDNLYYFDDIDRIDEQNFVRFGMINRLQTRQGDKLTNYFSMENYWDLFFQDKDDYGHVGEFCTKLTMTPLRGLTLSSFFAISPSSEYLDELRVVERNGRDAGSPGLNLDWLSRFSFTAEYSPISDVSLTFGYQYQNPYMARSAYSMGSTLTDIESGTAFNRYYTTMTQQLTFGFRLPITPDRRTFLAYALTYDVNLGFAPTQKFQITRQFHCVELAATLLYETENSNGQKENDISFMVTARLLKLTGPLSRPSGGMISVGQALGNNQAN